MDAHQQCSLIFRALAHPVRLRIVQILLEEGEACVCHLEARLQRRQAYISQHLSRLREVGLVTDRREGSNVYYQATSASAGKVLAEAAGLMQDLFGISAQAMRLPELREPHTGQCACPICAEKQAALSHN
jgi:DNA-binding transcriptional ArsR family regulator